MKTYKISELSRKDQLQESDILLISRKEKSRWHSYSLSAKAFKQDLNAKLDAILGKLELIATQLGKIAEVQTKPASKDELDALLKSTPDYKFDDGATTRMLAKMLYELAHIGK